MALSAIPIALDSIVESLSKITDKGLDKLVTIGKSASMALNTIPIALDSIVESLSNITDKELNKLKSITNLGSMGGQISFLDKLVTIGKSASMALSAIPIALDAIVESLSKITDKELDKLVTIGKSASMALNTIPIALNAIVESLSNITDKGLDKIATIGKSASMALNTIPIALNAIVESLSNITDKGLDKLKSIVSSGSMALNTIPIALNAIVESLSNITDKGLDKLKSIVSSGSMGRQNPLLDKLVTIGKSASDILKLSDALNTIPIALDALVASLSNITDKGLDKLKSIANLGSFFGGAQSSLDKLATIGKSASMALSAIPIALDAIVESLSKITDKELDKLKSIISLGSMEAAGAVDISEAFERISKSSEGSKAHEEQIKLLKQAVERLESINDSLDGANEQRSTANRQRNEQVQNTKTRPSEMRPKEY
jgi:hypothetical protein